MPSDVDEYIKQIDATGFDGGSFCDFYISKGWKVGNTKMIDWRAAARTWKRKSIDAPKTREQIQKDKIGKIFEEIGEAKLEELFEDK